MKGYLTQETLKKIQNIVDSAEVPSDVGKLPGIIDNFSFDGFTADEYKNFYLLFAVFCLHDILPKDDQECLCKFVIACTYLCNRILTEQDIKIADSYLFQFCKQFEIIYGKDSVTPNMHLHCHLAECLLDYGPVYSFWLFSFERYNGMLGNLPTNKKAIEIQFMRRFCRDFNLISQTYPVELEKHFKPSIVKLNSSYADRGTLSDIANADYVPFLRLSSRSTDYRNIQWINIACIEIHGNKEMYTLSVFEHSCLESCYRILYPNLSSTNFIVPLSSWQCKIVYMLHQIYGCKESRSHRSSYVTSF